MLHKLIRLLALLATLPFLVAAVFLSVLDTLLGDGRGEAALWAAGPFLRASERWWGAGQRGSR
jgi:hypothetical protein